MKRSNVCAQRRLALVDTVAVFVGTWVLNTVGVIFLVMVLQLLVHGLDVHLQIGSVRVSLAANTTLKLLMVACQMLTKFTPLVDGVVAFRIRTFISSMAAFVNGEARS